MMLKKTLIAGLCAIGFAQASAIDLYESYDLALANDPTFRAALKEYEAGLANETIGRAALMPKINASYYGAQNRATQWGAAYSGGPNTANNFQYPSNYYGAFLNQPLFSLEALAKWKQGSAQADAARTKFVLSSQELLIRVLVAYLTTLNAQDQLDFQEAERNAFREQASLNKRMQQKGQATITDVLEAESAYQQSEARVVEAQNALEYARRQLIDVTKASEVEVQKLARLTERFRLLRLSPVSFDDWAHKALEANQELATMNSQVEVARQEYRKNHAAHYPTVSLVAGATSQSSNTVVSIAQTTNQNYIGVQVNLPIFNGGEITGRSRQTYAGYEKSTADRDVTQDKVLTELRKQYDLVQSSARKIEALTKAVESTHLLVKSTNAGIKAGEKVNLDALLANKNMYSTRKDLALAKYQYLIAYLKLHQVGGTVTVEDYNKIASFFERPTKAK
jgi:outer membrane protein, protease secretion system